METLKSTRSPHRAHFKLQADLAMWNT
jgi:hypothetical protein